MSAPESKYGKWFAVWPDKNGKPVVVDSADVPQRGLHDCMKKNPGAPVYFRAVMRNGSFEIAERVYNKNSHHAATISSGPVLDGLNGVLDALGRDGWTDISSEEWRQYRYRAIECDVCLNIIMVRKPKWLHVDEKGAHRILDMSGESHYFPPGWIHLSWRAKDGAPRFVK